MRYVVAIFGALWLVGCQKTATNAAPASEPPYTYVSGQTFSNQKVFYSVANGDAVFDGDISLGSAEEAAERKGRVERGRGIRGAVSEGNADLLWPGGVVPYAIEGADRALVEGAMAHITERGPGVRFVPRTDESDYVNFVSLPERICTSRVGRVGGEQFVKLGPTCGTRDVRHELMHVLGFWHEHARSDRDAHIEFVLDHIPFDYRLQVTFRLTDDLRYGPYDTDSIMHYGKYAYSVLDGKLPTILVRGAPETPIGEGEGLSAGDIKGLNVAYPPPIPPTPTATPTATPTGTLAPSATPTSTPVPSATPTRTPSPTPASASGSSGTEPLSCSFSVESAEIGVDAVSQPVGRSTLARVSVTANRPATLQYVHSDPPSFLVSTFSLPLTAYGDYDRVGSFNLYAQVRDEQGNTAVCVSSGTVTAIPPQVRRIYRAARNTPLDFIFTNTANEASPAYTTYSTGGFGAYYFPLTVCSTMLTRCRTPLSQHFVSVDAGCETTPTSQNVSEGPYGAVCTTQVPGSKRLYRLFFAGANGGAHLMTTDASERATLLQQGWVDQPGFPVLYAQP